MEADAVEKTAEVGRVLVVDDYPLSLLKLTRILEQQGHIVTTAGDGLEALSLMQADAFDVVLLDIVMPEMDGYQVLERMSCDGTLRDIPVIVISAVDDIDSIVRCIEMGAVDYLPKPFNPTVLKARLQTSLQRKKLRDLERSYLQQEIMLRQNEKLITLGRLSAGMAHELNNPASAVSRGVEQLQDAITKLERAEYRLGQLNLSAAQLETIELHIQVIHRRAKQPLNLDPLARNDQEYELETWLEDKGIEDAWEFAPMLVNIGYSYPELAELTEDFTSGEFQTVAALLCNTYSTRNLLEEIGHGTTRITEIIKALKSYSYLDQAPIQSIDIHEGLDDTLVMLRSKLKTGIQVRREYAEDLPRIEAYGSELNQVWTNIIDNAAGAMGGAGRDHFENL